jgi:hypothetical protein
VTRQELEITIRNTGRRAVPRLQGSVDLSALQ